MWQTLQHGETSHLLDSDYDTIQIQIQLLESFINLINNGNPNPEEVKQNKRLLNSLQKILNDEILSEKHPINIDKSISRGFKRNYLRRLKILFYVNSNIYCLKIK